MERWQRTAFRRAEATYRIADALWLADTSLEWRDLEADLRARAAAETRAAAEGVTIAEEALAAALREFRYEHGLVSGDDARRWLETWELSADEWKASVRRSLLLERWRHEIELLQADHPPSAETLRATAWPDLVCTGALERLVRELAGFVAVADVPPSENIKGASPSRLPEWLEIAPRVLEQSERLWPILSAAAGRREREITPERVRATVRARALDWTYYETHQLELGSEPAAAEAALRVREDGASLAVLAYELDRPLAIWSGCLEDADEPLRVRLVGAEEGDLLGPLPQDGGFLLVSVLARRPAREDDAALIDRAERTLWQEMTARAGHVIDWELPLG